MSELDRKLTINTIVGPMDVVLIGGNMNELTREQEYVKSLELKVGELEGGLTQSSGTIAALRARLQAKDSALEFAKGAIKTVQRIIVEALEHGTFDKTVCDFLTTEERKLGAKVAALEQERLRLWAVNEEANTKIVDLKSLTRTLVECLKEINHSWNTKNHTQDTRGFHFWYSAYIDIVRDALQQAEAQGTTTKPKEKRHGSDSIQSKEG